MKDFSKMGPLSVSPMGGPIFGSPLYLLGSLYETAKKCVRVITSFSVPMATLYVHEFFHFLTNR